MLANSEDYGRVRAGEPKIPVHACLGIGRCPWYDESMTCAMCRELKDGDDVSQFVDKLIAGN